MKSSWKYFEQEKQIPEQEIHKATSQSFHVYLNYFFSLSSPFLEYVWTSWAKNLKFIRLKIVSGFSCVLLWLRSMKLPQIMISCGDNVVKKWIKSKINRTNGQFTQKIVKLEKNTIFWLDLMQGLSSIRISAMRVLIWENSSFCKKSQSQFGRASIYLNLIQTIAVLRRKLVHWEM